MTGLSGSEVGKVRRRRRSEEERRRIVAESFEPGASVSVVARRHDVSTNLLFTWRRRYGTDVEGSGGSANFVPAVISTDAMAQAPVSSQAVAVSFSGRIEIELPVACRFIAGSDVDTAVLGDVLKILLGR